MLASALIEQAFVGISVADLGDAAGSLEGVPRIVVEMTAGSHRAAVEAVADDLAR